MGDGIVRSLQAGGRDVRIPGTLTPDTPDDGERKRGRRQARAARRAAAVRRREHRRVGAARAGGRARAPRERPDLHHRARDRDRDRRGAQRVRRTQSIEVPPDPDTLKEVSQRTGGRFFAAPNAADLEAVFERLGSSIGYTEELREITWVFAAAGLLLLVIGGALAAVWFNRFP